MSVQQRLRKLVWKPEATWREVAVISAALVFVISLLALAR